MTRDVFNQFVAALRYSYEQRMPAEEILNFWYQKTSFIPEAALESCRDGIVREHPQFFPKQFHSVLIRHYYSWRREHEEDSTERKCPHCDCGWVSVMEWDEFYKAPVPTAYACRVCRAGVAEKHKLKMLTMNQAKSEGHAVIDGRKPFAFDGVQGEQGAEIFL